MSERGACGGAAGEAPTASPAEGGEGPLETDELAERERGLSMSEQGLRQRAVDELADFTQSGSER